jgi:hypothetical protein
MQVAQPRLRHPDYEIFKDLEWAITKPSLDSPYVNYDGHPITLENLPRFEQPIQLKTPRLVLNLQPFYEAESIPITFEIGPVVTPRQILGALYTYYSMPITVQDLDEIANNRDYTDANDRYVDMEFNNDLRARILGGEQIPRRVLMYSVDRLEEINELDNGVLDVYLSV